MRACAVLVVAVFCAGCGKGSFSKRSHSGVYRYAIANLTTLDPGKVQDVDSIDLQSHLYEGLVSYDENNKVVPQLAAGWKLEDGGRSYVFSLRKDAKFHNGRAVTAEDVKWSLERNLDPSFDSSTASNYLSDIVGVKEFVARKASEVAGIKVVDAHTLKVTIDQPRAYFLGKLTYPCAFVIPKEALPGKEISAPSQAIGTGPFRMGTFAPEQSVELVANKEYYLGAPGVERIERPIVKDAATRLNMFRNGQLDYLPLERQDLAGVQSDSKLKPMLHFQARPAVNYLMLNPSAYPPFKDARVRRALTQAIDRERICSDVLGGVPVAKGLLPPGILGYREHNPSAMEFSPDQARRELAEAGYPGGKGMPPLTLALRASMPTARMLAEAVASDLNKNLGMNVKLREMEWRSLLETRNQHKLAFVVSSWYADYLDPENFLSFLLMTGSPENYEQYSNPAFDRLCAQADVEQNDAKRASLYDEAEDILLRDAVRIPIYYQQDAVLINPNVTGIRTNLFGTLPNRTVKVGD